MVVQKLFYFCVRLRLFSLKGSESEEFVETERTPQTVPKGKHQLKRILLLQLSVFFMLQVGGVEKVLTPVLLHLQTPAEEVLQLLLALPLLLLDFPPENLLL